MPNNSPQNNRDYVVSEGQLRTLFLLGTSGAVLILVVLLLLMSARPQGRYVTPDRGQYQTTLSAALRSLEDYREDPETGLMQIPIERAMTLVAERGVDDLEFALADTPEVADDPEALPDGEAVYVANCAACHQANGQGVPGAFPPIAGHIVELYEADGGREYLAHLLLYGLQGPIVVNGQNYNGLMPAWSQLSDAQLAAVLNYTLTAWDNEPLLPDDFEPYTAEEVEAERDLGLTPNDVHEARQALGLE